jgi:hypothetical protein
MVVTARSLSGRYRGEFFRRKCFVEQPSNDLAVLSDAETRHPQRAWQANNKSASDIPFMFHYRFLLPFFADRG